MKSESNKYRTLVLDIIVFIVGTVITKVIQFFLMPLYTTYLTTEAYGVAELTNNLSELLFPVATLCIYEAAFRFAVDPFFDNKKIISTVSRVLGCSLIIGSIITFITQHLFHYNYSYYLFFILYSYSIRICAAYYVRGNGLSKVFAMSGVVNAIFLSLCNVLFLILLQSNERGYLISIGLSHCCSALYLLIKGKILEDYNWHNNDKNAEKILLRYCLPLIFYNVLYWVTTISGWYILLWYFDSSITGKYIAAMKIAAVINVFQQAINLAFQLNSSRAYNEGNKELFYSEIINSFVAIYCTLGSVIICLIPVLARFTLRNDFYDAKVYLPIILLSAIINCLSSLLGTMYSTYRKTKRTVRIIVCGATVNIIFGILLTPRHGIWGVCIASVFCYLSQIIYKFIDIKRFSSIKFNLKIILPNIFVIFIQVLLISIDILYKYKDIFSICTTIIIIIYNNDIIIKIVKQVIGKNNSLHTLQKGEY